MLLVAKKLKEQSLVVHLNSLTSATDAVVTSSANTDAAIAQWILSLNFCHGS